MRRIVGVLLLDAALALFLLGAEGLANPPDLSTMGPAEQFAAAGSEQWNTLVVFGVVVAFVGALLVCKPRKREEA